MLPILARRFGKSRVGSEDFTHPTLAGRVGEVFGIHPRRWPTRNSGQPDHVSETLKEPVMVRSIMVPLDGSTFSEHALPLALSVARRANAGVCLMHVHAPLAEATLEGIPILLD